LFSRCFFNFSVLSLVHTILKMDVTNDILEQLKTQQEQLQQQRSDIDTQLKRINAAISELTGGPKQFNWAVRAIECITSKKEMVQTLDILECTFWDNKTELLDEDKKRRYTVALSVALVTLYKDHRINKTVLKGVKGHFYGLNEWFDKKGNLLPAYHKKLMKKVEEQQKQKFASVVS
jgi:DNA repair exonuclease SbcCD ATPase subunit